MNSRIWIPAVAGALLLAACGQSDKNPTRGGDSNPGGSDTAPSAAGDTATTPGGNAGDASTTPGTPSTPAENPPAGSPEGTQPSNPPSSSGGGQ
jgi:hypothetical protein